MKYTKWFISFLLLLTIVGCTNRENRNNEYTDTYQLLYFYIDTCPVCQDFEENVLPLITEEFGRHMEIIMYDLDAYETREVYEDVIHQLIDYDVEEDYGYAPFIVLDGYFAKLGIGRNDGEEFIDDLIRAVQGKPLGNALSNDRYLFINGHIKE